MACSTLAQGKIRVLVIDNHERFRRGICSILNLAQDIDVVAGVTQQDAENYTHAFRPDVILLGLNLQLTEDGQQTQRLKQSSPNSSIILLTVLEPTKELLNHVRQDVTGYLTKNVSPSALLNVVHRVVLKDLMGTCDAFGLQML